MRLISSLHLELRNNTDSNTTWTARLHFTNIDDYIHTFTNGKGKTYTFGSSFKAKILNAIDDGEKNSTKFEIINPDQNIPTWEINKIIASKLSVTTSILNTVFIMENGRIQILLLENYLNKIILEMEIIIFMLVNKIFMILMIYGFGVKN